MKITIQRGSIAQIEVPLAVVSVFEGDDRPQGSAAVVDAALGGLLGQLIADKEITGKPNEVTVVHTHGKVPAQRVAVVGFGKRGEFALDQVRQASASASLKARRLRVKRFATVAYGIGEAGLSAQDCGKALAEGAILALYRYERFKQPTEETLPDVEEMIVVVPDEDGISSVSKGVRHGEIVANSTNLSRDLSNGPPNLVTPEYMADKPIGLAGELGCACEVLGVDELQRKGMGALLAVG